MTDRYGLAVCGLGPAGVGVLVAAARTGALDALLAGGVIAYDRRTDRFGGSLLDYQITANSFADVFLESLAEPGSGDLLAGLGDTPEAARLREHTGQYPPLPLAGAFVALVGQRVVEVLARHPRCTVRTGTAVQSVHVAGPGQLTVHDAAGGAAPARAALLCCGGEEVTEVTGALEAQVLPGNQVVRDRHALAAAQRVTVLGGSHTAWAVAARTVVEHPASRVTVVQHRPPPLYFASAAEAKAEDYPFDEQRDVCPLSGRVHRFGGLRGPARALAARAAAGPVDRLRVVNSDRPWTPALLHECGALPADLVVPCLGYRAWLPEIRLAGRVLDRAAAEELVGTTGTETGSEAGLFAYGLGAGLRPRPQAGGEPGYQGRLDGVWVYQHDAGDVMVQRITDWLDSTEASR